MAMNHQRVREAFNACRAIVDKHGENPKPVRIDPAASVAPIGGVRPLAFWQHLAFCCETGIYLATESQTLAIGAEDTLQDLAKAKSRMEKAMRWLGFLQGVLWGGDYATLEELKKMNMPPFAEPETALPQRMSRPTSTGEPREDEQ